jgi:hypothetical protein
VGEPSGEVVRVPAGAVPETSAEAVRTDTVNFDELYRSAYGPVVHLAYALSGSWAIAEEVAQETFLRALGRLERLDDAEGWVRRVAANLARSRMRRLEPRCGRLGVWRHVGCHRRRRRTCCQPSSTGTGRRSAPYRRGRPRPLPCITSRTVPSARSRN